MCDHDSGGSLRLLLPLVARVSVRSPQHAAAHVSKQAAGAAGKAVRHMRGVFWAVLWWG